MKKFKLIIYLCTVIALGLVVLDIVIDFDSSIKDSSSAEKL